MFETFERENFFQVPHFLNFKEVMDLREQIRISGPQFRPASLGISKLVDARIRSDEICWIDPEMTARSVALQVYFSKLEDLKNYLNEKYFLGLKSVDSHFAVFQAGTFYQRHLDRSIHHQSARKVSLVCYLNSDWQVSHGGALRIYQGEHLEDIQPIGGTLVGFLSDEVEHEVMPSYSERLSLTSWFLDSI